ncbi:hypothetical protein [Alphabaculovirus altersperidaniae]|uniref:Uncharacterized protein n=1 Tax=Spodoptera eridania nucleopolyhedrovirus TaxID=2315721 RepID=A0ABX6TQ39_9ABAC|nr:hypothetical protein QKS47_gp128 [Spodoptera eridania nucleopolyhedrovirus]QNV47838.1 hypothetical protein [Spodoptera eridania nucleopolyhedrovirus]
MQPGKLCLAVDSFRRLLRRINRQVQLIQINVDFNEPLPNLAEIESMLGVFKNNLMYVHENAVNRRDVDLSEYIQVQVVKELEFVLEKYYEEKIELDLTNCHIRTCLEMLNRLQRVNRIGKDGVKDFLLNMDVHVDYNSIYYRYMVECLADMIVLCDTIKTRLLRYSSSSSGNTSAS